MKYFLRSRFIRLAVALVVLFAILELGLQWQLSRAEGAGVNEWASTMLGKREKENRFIAHNIVHFAQFPKPASVTLGFLGTSRTRVTIAPAAFRELGIAVNAGSNSYNEMTHALLVEADQLKLRFPNLDTLFVEASLLQRRPARPRFIVDTDHRKYLPLLRPLHGIVRQAGGEQVKFEIPAVNRRRLLSRDFLLGLKPSTRWDTSSSAVFSGSAPLLRLKPNGELRGQAADRIPAEKQPKSIDAQHIKVRRLRDISSDKPWDGVFDALAVWGKQRRVDVIFFEPPVRSDLHEFQVEYGLDAHQADLQRLSQQHGVAYVSLNETALGYSSEWSMFSDEDHLRTCDGMRVLAAALILGRQYWKEEATPMPRITLEQARRKAGSIVGVCEPETGSAS